MERDHMRDRGIGRYDMTNVELIDDYRSSPSRGSKAPVQKSKGLKELIERTPRRDNDALQTVLSDIEYNRDAIRQAYIRTMLGSMGRFEGEEKLPREVKEMIRKVDDLETMVRRSKNFIIDQLPNDKNRPGTVDASSLPSYTSGFMKYLFARDRAEDACFGVAVPLEEYLNFEIDDCARPEGAEGKTIHARPFIHIPSRKVPFIEAGNRAIFEDTAELGDFLPSYLSVYTEFVAFAIEDAPAVLGAHLLGKRFPDEANRLLQEHTRRTQMITKQVIGKLGYRSMLDTEEGFELASSGMPLFNVLKQWELHCCKSYHLTEFAEMFGLIDVKKVNDMEYAFGRPSMAPAS